MSVALHHGDMLDVIPRLVAEGVQFDACVTDPPYHLTSTLARFGKINIDDDTATSRRLQQKLDGAARLAHGFMNQQWDGGDIAFRPETWATVATILRPGAFLLAFGGTRTWHRLACAIEDGGFVIQDTIAWVYGSGFPKRRDALKPAFEPIVMAYKPGGKRELQIDECRIAYANEADKEKNTTFIDRFTSTSGNSGTFRSSKEIVPNVDRTALGRWPANLCHDGSDEVVALFPQTGKSTGGRIGNAGGGTVQNIPTGQFTKGDPGFGDAGSAARFFFSAKAGPLDRHGSSHPTVKPVELMKWLVQLVTPPNGIVLDPFAGSGTTGAAALTTGRNAILIERELQYVADIRERLAFYEGGGLHSTQAKNRNRKVELGPLFAGAAE